MGEHFYAKPLPVETRRTTVLAVGIAVLVALSVLFLKFLYWQTTQALARSEDAIVRVEREALRRSFIQCETSNEARSGIRSFLDSLALRDGTIDESERSGLELAKESFAPIECPPDPDAA